MAIPIDPVCIDDMTSDDIPCIAAIERRSYPVPWHETAYHTELTNQCAAYLVARINGTVVGYAGMWVIMDEAHITTIAVDPPHRGRGVGTLLLLGLMEAALGRGAGRATLEVREGNRVARRLYAKFGFAAAAIRRCYYTDNQENALVMWADGLRSPEYAEFLRRTRASLRHEEHDRSGYRDEL